MNQCEGKMKTKFLKYVVKQLREFIPLFYCIVLVILRTTNNNGLLSQRVFCDDK